MSTEVRCKKCERKLGDAQNSVATVGLTAACCGPGAVVFKTKCPRCGEINTVIFRPND